MHRDANACLMVWGGGCCGRDVHLFAGRPLFNPSHTQFQTFLKELAAVGCVSILFFSFLFFSIFFLDLFRCWRRQMFCTVLVELLSRGKSLCCVAEMHQSRSLNKPSGASWQRIVFMDGIIILELYVTSLARRKAGICFVCCFSFLCIITPPPATPTHPTSSAFPRRTPAVLTTLSAKIQKGRRVAFESFLSWMRSDRLTW